MKLIYIGEKFYQESGTIMSPLYEPLSQGFTRQDWGKVSVALQEGKDVHISPASKLQMEYFEKELKKIRLEAVSA